MHQPSGRHRRPRRTLAGRAWAVAAALLAAALTFVFVPPTPARERAALSPAPERPRLPAVPVPPARPFAPQPTPAPKRLACEPGDFPDRRAWVASARGTSTRWAHGYRQAGPSEEAGPLARPYMPPPPETRPLIPRPRTPECGPLAAPPQVPSRAAYRSAPGTPEHTGAPGARNNPDDLDDLAAVIRTYLAVIG